MARHYRSKSDDSFNLGFLDVLQMIFIVLKFTGNIDWPWWQVLMPICIILAGIICMLVPYYAKKIVKKK